MNPIGSIGSLTSPALTQLDMPLPKLGLSTTGTAPTEGFGKVLDSLVAGVEAKQDAAQASTRQVLLGETQGVHQSVIAMQEASVAFSLMVEVRNKLVESYQELMRMQV
jgi:flagellar hook-basal body complex protein FliE